MTSLDRAIQKKQQADEQFMQRFAAFKALLDQQMIDNNDSYFMKTAAGTLPVAVVSYCEFDSICAIKTTDSPHIPN